jgi:uncharacterized protein
MKQLRKAIAVHNTETTDEAWDGPANKTRLKLDQAESYYRKAYAWEDPEGDKTNKGTFKFIHHTVDESGNIGAANLRACTSGIGVLNGGRGGTTIPSDDKQGVWDHLAAHIRDAGGDPPALARSEELPGREIRSMQLSEIRVVERDAASPMVVGHAALFDTPTNICGWMGDYTESIRKGAFSKTIKEADVRALWNHDPSYVMGRNKSGTLRLSEDARGLAVEIDPPAATWANDLLANMRRGDVNQMSFAFEPKRQEWNSETNERSLIEVKLYDVSVVTYPAYEDTSASVREVEMFCRSLRGYALKESDRDLVTRSIESLRALLPAENTNSSTPGSSHLEEGAPGSSHPLVEGQQSEDNRTGYEIEVLRRRLRLISAV